MSARADLPPNVVELLNKASLRAPEPAAASREAKEEWDGQRLPLPGFDLASFGFGGRWQEVGASFVLEPPKGVLMRGIVHFLGGAFIGAAPHIGYRAMLDAVADEGFVIVATPYDLQFDYIDLCQGVLARSEAALLAMGTKYPGAPVFGLGHSCGALLHTILASAFDTLPPRRAYALLSFNSKPASESIPQFEELVAPVSSAVMDQGEGASRARLGIQQAIEEVQRRTDELAGSAVAPRAVGRELLPLAWQGFKVLEQLPSLLQQVADGTREFLPSPPEVRELVRGRFQAEGGALLVRFKEDSIDESPDLAEVLRSVGGGEEWGKDRVQLVDLPGTHVTPLTQDLFPSTPLDSFDPFLPLRLVARQELLRDVYAVSDEVVRFFDAELSK